MKIFSKKAVSLMLAAAMLTCGMSACGAKDSAKPKEAAKTADGKFDDVKLKMLICWNGGFKVATDQYDNEVAKAIRDKTGVTVEYEGIMMKETEKLNMMFASGDMPDMINAPYWGGEAGETAVIKKAAIEGRLLGIEDKIDNYENLKMAFDVGVVAQSFLESDLDDPEFEGHRYILPTETPGDKNGYTNWCYGVFVRGDVPGALGIDPLSIKTSEQLYDFMKKAQEHGFKDINGNSTIPATTYHDGWDYSGYSMSYADKKLTRYSKTEDGKYTYEPLTDAWVDRNMFTWKLVKDGLLDKECFKHKDSQADEKVGNGTALFATCQYGPIINSTKLTGLYDSNPEMRYVPVGPLNYASGEPIKQLEFNGRGGAPGIIFPTSCKDLDAALTYLDFLNSKEGAQLAQYGIEGDTCILNDAGQPRLNPEITKRKKANDSKIDQELRDKGITYMLGRTLLADKRKTWWGETNAGDAETESPETVAYRELRPVESVDGYSIASMVTTYKDYDKVKKFAFEGTTEEDYKQRAFFAETEEEARTILKEYQTYLLTQENGIFEDFLKFVGETAESREDTLL